MKTSYFPIIILSLVFVILTHSSPAMACTIFCYTQNGKTLVGNTEDWLSKAAQIRSYPATENEYGRVYIGFRNPSKLFTKWMPFGGMNDQGLMFDILLVPAKRIPYDIDKSRREDALEIIYELMKTCSTVAEIRAELETYNPSFLMMTGWGVTDGYQLFIADKDGNSLVYGGGEFIETSDYQAAANKFLYDVSFSIGTHGSYYRYTSALNMMKNLDAQFSADPSLELSIDHFLPVLSRVDHETGSMYATVYAYIMDLSQGLIYIYTPSLQSIHDYKKYMNYNNSTVINVAEETQHPYHKYNINSLPYDHVHSYSSVYADFNDHIDFLDAGDYIMYAPIDVIPGSDLNIDMTGTGNADLYVVFDRSTGGDWDYRSNGSSSDEHLNISVPLYSAQAYIMVKAYADSSDIDIDVDYNTNSNIPSSGNVLVNYEGHVVDRDSKMIYGPFNLKTGTKFIAKTEPGSRNANLYVFFGKNRNNLVLGGQSTGRRSEESVYIGSVPDTMEISPGHTSAYVLIEGRRNNSEYNLSVEYEKP